MQALIPASVPLTDRQRPGDDTGDEPLINGRKGAPVRYHDNDDGYIVPYDVMLGVLAHSYDSSPQPPPRESTKL